MEYNLRRSHRKTVSIKITSQGNVIVSAPMKCSLKFINEFVKSKEQWIITSVNKIKQKIVENEDYYNLKKIIVFGENYDVLDFGNYYMVGEYYIKHSKASNKKNVLRKFMLSLANEHILARVDAISKILNLDFKAAEIISARKKWGSCNNLKCLKFNFRLVMLPKGLIDYVICHELCHLTELNHSKKFWVLLEQLGYNKNKIRSEIKKYGFVLDLL